MSIQKVSAALMAAAMLVACSKAPPEQPAQPVPVAASAASAALPASADRWLGRWQGPEGTLLELAGSAGAYRVTVRNLDGPRSFDATAEADAAFSFVRDGVKETVRPGSGADTGMKWLADKRDCLVVKAGEGYCRD